MAGLNPAVPSLTGSSAAKKGAVLGGVGLSAPSPKMPTATTAAVAAAAPALAATQSPSLLLSGTTPASGVSLGGKAAPTSAASTPAMSSALAGALTAGTTPTAAAPADRLTFSQLEDSINKWTAELAEEERTFLAQATQINAWDKAINDNERRLSNLNNSVKQVQDQQTRINYDLDFILTQLRDLEQCVAPLEKDGDSYLTTKSEPQRKQLYLSATQIDSQMKRLSEDLKEVIEQINEASRAIDTSDPVLQVGRVLNAHMDSLNTIDENATRIHENLESLTKHHNRLKKDTELHHEL